MLGLILVPSVLFSLGLALVWGCGAMLFERLRGRPTRAFQRLCVAVAVTGFASFGSSLLLFQGLRAIFPAPLPSGSDTAEFNSKEWIEGDSVYSVDGDITPRQKMLGSLVDQLTPQMNRAEIEDLLGPPARPGFPYGAADCDLHYCMGRERDSSIPLDSEWLLIYLDDNGYYSHYRIYVD